MASFSVFLYLRGLQLYVGLAEDIEQIIWREWIQRLYSRLKCSFQTARGHYNELLSRCPNEISSA